MIQVARALDLYKTYIIQSQIDMAWESEGFELNRDTVTKGVEAVFLDPDKGFYLVATDGGKAVGCLLVVREWSDWRNGTVLWIHSVYVSPEYRKRGVFKTMYEYLKTEVLKHGGFKGIRLYVDKANLGAIEVYKKIGMTDQHYNMFEWLT